MKYGNKRNLIKDKCLICDTIENLESHRIEIGGPYIQSNVLCLCRIHHILIHKLIRRNRWLSTDELICKAREIYEFESN